MRLETALDIGQLIIVIALWAWIIGEVIEQLTK